VIDPPPPYEWSFSMIPPGAQINTDVGFIPDDPSPVPFVPGYDISRTFDVTRFEEPGVQTLTIELTPQDGMPPWFGIHVIIPQDIPFTASIESCVGANDYQIWDEGHRLQLSEPFGEHPQNNYIYTIEIFINPGAYPVEFWPDVEVLTFPIDNIPITDAGVHSSYTKEVAGMGTWTYDLSSEYSLSVFEQIAYHVVFETYFAELVNESTVLFQEFWTHIPTGDEFTNGDAAVPGNISWVTQILNQPDYTGEPVSDITLDLDTSEVFDRVIPPVDGPPYQWNYEAIPEGEIRAASVSTFPDPVEFSPGFDAARSFDQTLFSEPGTQTLTINVTPREEYVDLIIIDIFTIDDENANAVITSFTGADGVFQNQDGHRLMMVKMTPEIDTEYELTVTIDITPNVPQVKYQPVVRIYDPGFTSSGEEFGSSVTHDMPDVGTWTCSTDRDYRWSWLTGNARAVVFPPASSIVITDFSIEHMSVDFDNRRPNMDRIAISEATINLGEAATYDLSLDDVVVNVDGVVITIPAGSFIKQGNNECYHYESTSSTEPQINMELDFKKGEWRLKISKIDAGAIDNSDGVEITLTIGTLSATELIDMQVGGLTFIADQ